MEVLPAMKQHVVHDQVAVRYADGVDHVWTTEHPDFYVRDSAGNVITPINNEGKPTDWTDVAELDYANPALRKAMIEKYGLTAE